MPAPIPKQVEGRVVIPTLFIAAHLHSYCRSLVNSPDGSVWYSKYVIASKTKQLVIKVVCHIESQGYTVDQLTTPDGIDALCAVADVVAVQAPAVPIGWVAQLRKTAPHTRDWATVVRYAICYADDQEPG